MKGRVEVIIVAVPIMNATINEDEKNEIKLYLLGQLAEADEERVEMRLMSDPAFSDEFDVIVDEIATLYVSRHFTGDEQTRVEQYFLRAPQRREKVQFICELARQVNEPAMVTPAPPGFWQRITSFWAQPSTFRPAVTFASLLIVAALGFWLISNNFKPTYQSFELAMTTSTERDSGTEITRIQMDDSVDVFRIKLKLPTPAAPQYRASLRGVSRGDAVWLPQLTIETQDAESITVMAPASEIGPGTYVIELTEINNGSEKPLRSGYEFTLD